MTCNLGRGVFEKGFKVGFKKSYMESRLETMEMLMNEYRFTLEEILDMMSLRDSDYSFYEELLEKKKNGTLSF